MNCERCGEEFDDAKSKCPCCGHWHVNPRIGPSLISLSEVEDTEISRYETGDCDPCLGGGMVPGTIVLLGGEPGAGKSTLALQLTNSFESSLYIASEESGSQIKGRGKRLEIRLDAVFLLPILGTDGIINSTLDRVSYKLVILDSLPGLVGFGNDAAAMDTLRTLKGYAVANDACCIILDHVTKTDLFAGRIALQHEVDATISLTVEEDQTRILRTIKNRHGASGVSVLFDMTEKGLYVQS